MLRSLYTVYDFGDFDSSGQMGNPYVKLLSVIDPQEASVDFHNIRGGTPNKNVTYNASDSPNGSTVSVNISDNLAKTLNTLGTYFPALLALVALNALVVLILLAAGIVYIYRRRSQGQARRRVGLGRTLTPMPGREPVRDSAFDMPVVEAHQYQPVSMALTEDPLIPPSPSFSQLSKFDRPRSVA